MNIQRPTSNNWLGDDEKIRGKGQRAEGEGSKIKDERSTIGWEAGRLKKTKGRRDMDTVMKIMLRAEH